MLLIWILNIVLLIPLSSNIPKILKEIITLFHKHSITNIVYSLYLVTYPFIDLRGTKLVIIEHDVVIPFTFSYVT